jgi:hypothetical protein
MAPLFNGYQALVKSAETAVAATSPSFTVSLDNRRQFR